MQGVQRPQMAQNYNACVYSHWIENSGYYPAYSLLFSYIVVKLACSSDYSNIVHLVYDKLTPVGTPTIMEPLWKSDISDERWFFTSEQLMNTPSRRHGIDLERELKYRQESASLICDAGLLLDLTIGIINTAVVYMHRFYMFHSFAKFHRYSIAATALFLAAKAGDDFHKISDILAAYRKILESKKIPVEYMREWRIDVENIFFNEDVMLQTLGFAVEIEHPHTHIIKFLKKANADDNKDIRRSSYYLATQMIHLTTFSIQFKPSVIACLAIYSALKWTEWSIPVSSQGKEWYYYVDPSVTVQQLDELVDVFLKIYSKSKARIKETIKNLHENAKKHKKILSKDHRKPSGNLVTATRPPLDMTLPKFGVSEPLASTSGVKIDGRSEKMDDRVDTKRAKYKEQKNF